MAAFFALDHSSSSSNHFRCVFVVKAFAATMLMFVLFDVLQLVPGGGVGVFVVHADKITPQLNKPISGGKFTFYGK
jgi:hypothetical protein